MFCPKKKGYFPFLTTKIRESLSLEDKANFAALRSAEDRIKFVLSLPRLSSAYEDNLFKIIKPLHGEKSKEKSEENREAGNVSFHSGNYRQAQILYSIAVFTAPAPSDDDDCFALAVANRSACLQRLHSNRLAISDIDLALDSGYPDSKAFKLHERKAECLERLGALEESVRSYDDAIDSLQRSTPMPKDKRDKIEQSLTGKLLKVQTRLQEDHFVVVQQQHSDVEDDLICDISEPNPLFPSAHSSIEIRHESHFGRYAVAAEDIPLGTALVNERPITYSLYSEKFGSNCQHCFSVIRAVVPCPTCSWVCFCSPGCRNAALETYHKYECPILKLLLESGLNVYSFLTLRAVCKEGLRSLLSLKDSGLLRKRDETAGTTAAAAEDAVYRSDDFRNLINLVAQEDLLDSEEWFLRTFIACFLLKLLMITTFFDLSSSKTCKGIDLTDDQLYIGRVLLQLLNICPYNCHDISEIESPVPDQFAPSCNKVSLGAGMYPTLALFNHACKPDFMRCNRGNGVVCVANRYIRKGEEICENYGLMYTMKPVKERQRILKDHYKFECCCQACVENWPTLSQMKIDLQLDPEDRQLLRFKRFRCFHCGSNLGESAPSPNPARTCLLCGGETDLSLHIPLKRIKELSGLSVQYLLTGQWGPGVETAAECHDLIQRHLSFPMLEMTEVQIAIWKCMWLKIGNMKLVKLI